MNAPPAGTSRLRDRSSVRIAATALLVCVGYYVGANIGFILRFPPATPSVMWPPNAILTAALLLAPVRRWWIYLLAAVPAHLAAELGAFPPSLVLLFFLTNCSEALVAAVCVRRLSDAPTRFDTLRRVASFVVAGALLAPFVSSFADAAAVTAVRGEPYWLVWRTRFFSNILTELTVVPVLVMLITAGPKWIRSASTRRGLEAAVLASTLVTVGIVVFTELEGLGRIPGSPHTPLAFLLPFMLWATVRFGPAGASFSLLGTALIAIFAGTHGQGPFTSTPLAESVFALQIFLSVVAIAFMCLAAVIEERRRTEAALAERLRFEEMLSRLSGAFVHLPTKELDEAFGTWLQRVGEFLNLDRVLLLRPAGNDHELAVRYSWAAPGCGRGPQIILNGDLPWAARRVLHGQGFAFSRLDELPIDAVRDKDWLHQQGIVSSLTIPLVAGQRILGALAFITTTAERVWPDGLVQGVRLVAAVFANALARKESEDALRASELMKTAILGSLSSTVAVLDRDGQVIAVNKNRVRDASEQPVAADATIAVGMNYVESWRNAARQGLPLASEALEGIDAVLAGSRAGFGLEYRCRPEYPCSDGTAERWMAMSVVPLDRPEGGAVVSHTDISERKSAEMEVQRSHQELAHFMRVSTMGELTASLAHELSQPLTGIMTNAQAARRFLEATPPDVRELQHILSDIVEDDKRAGDVIHRLRDLLRKGELQKVVLDLNVLIRDVTRLLSSDAVIRNISMTVDLDPQPVVVSGDRVQLQQVVLNLMLNAMDSTAESAADTRTVVVRTRAREVEAIEVSVEDAGTGLRPGTEDLVFEPFYTTKPAGMGMGLSIAKSIIEEHGGVIWAANNPTRGASFHFALPAAGKALA